MLDPLHTHTHTHTHPAEQWNQSAGPCVGIVPRFSGDWYLFLESPPAAVDADVQLGNFVGSFVRHLGRGIHLESRPIAVTQTKRGLRRHCLSMSYP